MKKRIASLIAGLLVVAAIGVTIAFAQETQVAKQDWSRLKIVTYQSGLTGFFDPDSGRLYVYDAHIENCIMVRQLVRLGEPLVRITN